MDFAGHILKWYDANRRDLPWRHTHDPYKIWLSEVILQQTRVEQGKAYYLRFSSQYPTIRELADAPEQQVLKLWQGLGYYSRARNLLFAAKQLMTEFDGVFPGSYQDIIKLKGIGEYTAAAIASIAFGEAVAVVDGNVKRVISRIYGLESTGSHLQREVKLIMSELLDERRPGDFNQAVMEFGALNCTPLKPLCNECIFNKDCKALQMGRVESLPKKELKKVPQNRYFSYLVVNDLQNGGNVIMKKRSGKDIWKNLYEFPLIETEHEVGPDKLMQEPLFRSWFRQKARITESSKHYKHQLTHRTIHARFHFVVPEKELGTILMEEWEAIPHKDIPNYPVSRLIDRFLKDHKSKIEL